MNSLDVAEHPSQIDIIIFNHTVDQLTSNLDRCNFAWTSHLLTTACPLQHLMQYETLPSSPSAPPLPPPTPPPLQKAFADYQLQLWDPLSVPIGFDSNDAGYTCGGVASQSGGGFVAGDNETETFGRTTAGRYFHVFGETLGLFALDVRQRPALLQVRRKKRKKKNRDCGLL